MIEPLPEPTLEIRITMTQSMKLSVVYPPGNKVLALGMLECAREAIIENEKRLQSGIVAPPADMNLAGLRA
jgi:hypothetical protein